MCGKYNTLLWEHMKIQHIVHHVHSLSDLPIYINIMESVVCN